MVLDIKISKGFHHGRQKQDFRLSGIIELWVDDIKVKKRKFRWVKERSKIIWNWYRIVPNLKNNYHYFIIKYLDE